MRSICPPVCRRLCRRANLVIIGVEVPQLIELPMQIGNGLDLLGRHGADHREAQAKRGDETQALDQAKRLTAFIEKPFQNY